jgi:hypothetical protein
VFPAPVVLEPGAFSAEIPPPDPPEAPSCLLKAPAPPPADVIVEKVEGDPSLPVPGTDESSNAPPAPTVIV